MLLYPLGTMSATLTPVALFGPALAAVSVKVTVSPALIEPLPSASVVNGSVGQSSYSGHVRGSLAAIRRERRGDVAGPGSFT